MLVWCKMLCKIALLSVFNCISHLAATDTQCKEFTMDIVDMLDFSHYKPMNNSITSSIHTSAKELRGCDYLRVYLELENPVIGLTTATANFTLMLEHKPLELPLENHVKGGLIAGIILALIFCPLVAYFGYYILMEKLRSGVYRIPPTSEVMQFQAL